MSAPPDVRDPERPGRLLHEVLARPEFGGDRSDSPDWLRRLLDEVLGSATSTPEWLGAAITALVLGAAAFFVAFLLFDGRGRRHRRRPHPAALAPVRRPDLPGSAVALFRFGLAARRDGRAAEAIVSFFRAMIVRLVDRGLLLADPSRTNREHLRDLGPERVEKRALATVLPTFERVRYGLGPAEPEDVERVFAAARTLFPGEAT